MSVWVRAFSSVVQAVQMIEDDGVQVRSSDIWSILRHPWPRWLPLHNQWHVDCHSWLGQVTPAATIGNWWAKEEGPRRREFRPYWQRLAPLLQQSTNDMGCFGSGGGDGDVNGKRERRRRHKEIQKQIQQDKQIYRATHRLLLLGNNHHLSSAYRPYWITVFTFHIIFVHISLMFLLNKLLCFYICYGKYVFLYVVFNYILILTVAERR